MEHRRRTRVSRRGKRTHTWDDRGERASALSYYDARIGCENATVAGMRACNKGERVVTSSQHERESASAIVSRGIGRAKLKFWCHVHGNVEYHVTRSRWLLSFQCAEWDLGHPPSYFFLDWKWESNSSGLMMIIFGKFLTPSPTNTSLTRAIRFGINITKTSHTRRSILPEFFKINSNITQIHLPNMPIEFSKYFQRKIAILWLWLWDILAI